MAAKKQGATATTTDAPVEAHRTQSVTVQNGGDPAVTQQAVAGAVADAAAAAPDLNTEPKGEPANIPAATEFDPSGAPVQTVVDADPNNPAVDANPRANTTVDQNRIDFNDPTKTGPQAVADNLKAQGLDVGTT